MILRFSLVGDTMKKKGATENTEGEAVFKQVLKDCTEKIILMVLESKRNKVYFYKSLLPEDIDIVI